MNDVDRAQEPFFVFAESQGRRFADFTMAFTAENARRVFSADFNIPMENVGAFPLDENSEEVKRIMASKGFYINPSPGKEIKLKAKGSQPKKAGKGKGSVNKGRKGHSY